MQELTPYLREPLAELRGGFSPEPGFRLKAEPVTDQILPEGEGITPMLGFNGSTLRPGAPRGPGVASCCSHSPPPSAVQCRLYHYSIVIVDNFLLSPVSLPLTCRQISPSIIPDLMPPVCGLMTELRAITGPTLLERDEARENARSVSR